MTATLILFKPPAEDSPISIEEVMTEIEQAGVVFGINREIIEKCVREQDYNNPMIIASGKRPQRGEDSQFTYHFNTQANWTPKEDEDGRIDYKNINFIQSVEKDEILVTKIPPKPGTPGMTVKGKELKGLDGRDFPFNHGTNTRVSDDGLQLLATTGGSILYLYNKVAVNNLTIINSDVDFNVGNIDCKGSVRVNGDIKAGFTIKLDGDLEVNGNVEDCVIDVKGNVMVKGGFFGKGEGLMKAGGDVTLKYVEGQKILATNIYIGGEIINSKLLARERIHVKGRKGKIVGGDIKAGKEIRASELGSKAGTSTVLNVLLDPEMIKKYQETTGEIERLIEDQKRIKDAMVALYRLQIDKKLTPDKERVLKQFERFQAELPANLEKLRNTKSDIEEHLKKFDDAQIVAEDIIYSGVRVHFGIVYRDIMEEKKKCKLTLGNNQIYISELKEPLN
ncbi:MAG: DUF342 domain-containing protein [candidate division Zixibacteria bacterium]|nr:DUF342 domain-containing protein [candidate division Zixibacteria bacterium]